MITSIYTLLENYFNVFLQTAVEEHFKLVDAYNFDLYKLDYQKKSYTIFTKIYTFDMTTLELQDWLELNF
jgi:hypothetical protein